MDIRAELKSLKSNKVEEIGAAERKMAKNKNNKTLSEVEDEEKQWISKASDVINLKLVASRQDLEDPSTTFHPSFTHQIFEDEEIKGYKGLQVNLFYSSSSLASFFEIHSSSIRPYQVDDVKEKIFKHLPKEAIPISNLDEYVRIVESDRKTFRPPGKHINSYTLNDNNNGNSTYEIYQGNFNDDKMVKYHYRLSLNVLWFIDGSSLIDETDKQWEIYLLFQKKVDVEKHYYSIVGYSTVYNFYSHPEKTRKRISQFLILPPFQKQGHGRRLLNTIYEAGKPSSVRDFTVEDPSKEFSMMRDIVDAINLKKADFFQENKFVTEMEDETIEQIRSTLKLCPAQIKHMHEIFWFKNVDTSDERQYKKYRLAVKRRLYKKYSDILSEHEDSPVRKKALEEIYRELESDYKAILSKLE